MPFLQDKLDKLKMMIASIFITTFCLLSGIQAEIGVCHGMSLGPFNGIHGDGEDYQR